MYEEFLFYNLKHMHKENFSTDFSTPFILVVFGSFLLCGTRFNKDALVMFRHLNFINYSFVIFTMVCKYNRVEIKKLTGWN